MRYLTVSEVIELYRQVMETSGGTVGILRLESLESAVALPRATFGGKELYPTIIEKAAAHWIFTCHGSRLCRWQ